MKLIALDDLLKIAELAPDLSIGAAAAILEWVADVRGRPVLSADADVSGGISASVVPAPAEPAIHAGGGLTADAPLVAAAPPSRAVKGAAATIRDRGREKPRVTGPRRSWTGADIKRARQLQAEGLTYAEIGKQMMRTGKAVSVALSKARLAERAEDGGADVADRKPGKAPDDGDRADVGLQSECPASRKAAAPAPVADIARPEDVPGMGQHAQSSGSGEQPPGHGAVGDLDVADAARVSAAPVASVIVTEGAADAAALAEVQDAPVIVPQGRNPVLSRRQSRLIDHLSRLSRDAFTPEDDLWLVEQLASGAPIAVIADQLGCTPKTAIARFAAMKTDDIVTARGRLTIDGQADLLVAAHYRAGCHE